MVEYDFETRQSDSPLKEWLAAYDDQGGDAEMLNAPSTVGRLVRAFLAFVSEKYGGYLDGSIGREGFAAEIEKEAERLQGILYGEEPDAYWPTAWHSPDHLGKHILTFGPVAEQPEQAVRGLLMHLVKQYLTVVNGMDDVAGETWKAELDALVENYQTILMGYARRPE